MRKLLSYILLWMLSGGLYLRGNIGATSEQTIPMPHIEGAVTENAPVRLKDVDIYHPLFILK